MNRCKLGMAAVAALLIGFSGMANADVLQFFGEDLGLGEGTPLPAFPNSTAAQADFLALLQGVGTEDFEGFAAGSGSPLPLVFPGAGTATLNGAGFVNNVTPGTTNGAGRYGTSGSQFWEVTGAFSVSFSDPVAAFGFFGIDIGDFDGQITLEFQLESGATDMITLSNTVNGAGGAVLFFGYINTDDLITGVTFGNTAAGVDFFGFDDFTIGSFEQVDPGVGGGGSDPIVPEPATMALFGIGLAGLALRKRSAQA